MNRGVLSRIPGLLLVVPGLITFVLGQAGTLAGNPESMSGHIARATPHPAITAKAPTRPTTPTHVRAAAATTAGTPCGTLTASTRSQITHVVWIVFENKSYDQVFDTPSVDPYLTGLAGACGVATNYSATPDTASKLALTSGTDWGVTGDANIEPGPDIYSQLGTNWRQYMGGMTTDCQIGDSVTSSGIYDQRHNPASYFTDATAACQTQDVPLPSDPSQIDLSAAFTWIEADVPNSMHGCPTGCPTTSTAQLAQGDAWASQVIPALLQTPQYQSGSTAIFVVWDQASGSDTHSTLIAVSPYVPAGSTTSTSLDHYSLLRGTEEYLGLPLLQHAGDPGTTSVGGLMGLPRSVVSALPTSNPLPPVGHQP